MHHGVQATRELEAALRRQEVTKEEKQVQEVAMTEAAEAQMNLNLGCKGLSTMWDSVREIERLRVSRNR